MIRATFAAATLLALLFVQVGHAAAASDGDAILQLLMKTFDRPDARLAVDPVVVANDHAVADWIQDNRGGRALLKRKAGQWMLVLCSGDAIKSAEALRHAGEPTSDAARLAANLESVESSLPADHRALLDTFEGTVLMGADGEHPTGAHGAGGHQAGGQPPHDHPGARK